MSNTLHALAAALVSALAVCLSRTATAQGTGVDLLDYEGTATVVLDAGAATAGSSPTLEVTLDESDDNSTWTAVPAAAYAEGTNFTQVTTTAGVQIRHFNVSERKRYLRGNWVIGGTSNPAFPFGLAFIGRKKYSG